jgi:hypothetical protein
VVAGAGSTDRGQLGVKLPAPTGEEDRAEEVVTMDAGDENARLIPGSLGMVGWLLLLFDIGHMFMM